MKDINDYINEGWSGTAGENAFEDILSVWENMKQEDILIMIWKYFSQDDLRKLYKWMDEDGYFE